MKLTKAQQQALRGTILLGRELADNRRRFARLREMKIARSRRGQIYM